MDFKDIFKNEKTYIYELANEIFSEHPELEPIREMIESDCETNVLMESFAFLAARLHQKVDDAFPEVTHNLLNKIFPLPLTPLPAS